MMTNAEIEEMIKGYFPNVLSGSEFEKKVVTFLDQKGFTSEKTLFGHSVCPDPANTNTTNFKKYYEAPFRMGGLGGLPTDIGRVVAAMKQIPKDGKLFIYFSSHIGITDSGELGLVRRKGHSEDLPCCSAQISYLKKAEESHNNKLKGGHSMVYVPQDMRYGREQHNLESGLAQYNNRILSAENRILECTLSTSGIIHDKIHTVLDEIVKRNEVGFKGKVAIVGGVTINTSRTMSNFVSENIIEIVDYKIDKKIHDYSGNL